MPILYNEINGGRFLTVIFFMALVLAGLSSMVANIELFVHNVGDFGGKSTFPNRYEKNIGDVRLSVSMYTAK